MQAANSTPPQVKIAIIGAGFGGIGAILRYKVNYEQLADYDDEDELYDD